MAVRRDRRVVEKFAKLILEAYKEKLRENNAVATGELERTRTRVKVDRNNVEYEIIFITPDYWEFVEHGRAPGKQPPPDVILEWIRQKPIIPQQGRNKLGQFTKIPTENQLAYLIGRKIGEEGIPARPYREESVAEYRDQYLTELADAIILDLGDDVDKFLQPLNKTLTS